MKFPAGFLFLFSFSVFAASPEEWVQFSKVQAWPSQVSLSTDRVELTAVILDGSPWTLQEVHARFQRANEIFGQCGIGMGAISVIKARLPRGRTILTNDLDRWMARNSPAGLVVFFVDSHERNLTAYSGASGSALWGRAWLTRKVREPLYTAHHQPGYEPLAHELAHLLCGCGHQSGYDDNLLADFPRLLSDALTPEQCSVMKKSPWLKRTP